jgi:hypothetical protein
MQAGGRPWGPLAGLFLCPPGAGITARDHKEREGGGWPVGRFQRTERASFGLPMETSMTDFNTFHASISPKTLDKVTRLFNASLTDIFNELIQNARRAGASRIDVRRIEDERTPARLKAA